MYWVFEKSSCNKREAKAKIGALERVKLNEHCAVSGVTQ